MTFFYSFSGVGNVFRYDQHCVHAMYRHNAASYIQSSQQLCNGKMDQSTYNAISTEYLRFIIRLKVFCIARFIGTILDLVLNVPITCTRCIFCVSEIASDHEEERFFEFLSTYFRVMQTKSSSSKKKVHLVCPTPPSTATPEEMKLYQEVTDPLVLKKRPSVKGITVRYAANYCEICS
ncbi:pseudouridine synthase family protein [Artemisia annua]|uniref:Pseudouridine synthase family protein n=1 Tax=Artemisia annua TaxID=35608 RepID=A0A2U1MYS1_ARTAN|nr:pseudouridine synthase family protein [Artemisia annua]